MQDTSSPTLVTDREAVGDPGATQMQDVPALTYTQLRLLAECTAGLEVGEEVEFVFTSDGDLKITSDPQDDEILITAGDGGRYPRNVVRLQAEPGGGELRLEPGFADAVFWSDAAVQKFLFPYVSSCAGTDASRVLARLQTAWNHYPADEVTVYALVHVVRHSAGIPLSLDNRIQVVYAPVQAGPDRSRASLRLATLSDFLGEFELSVAAATEEAQANGTAAGRVKYHRGKGSPGRQYPDYSTLRALAEHACALCDGPRYFLFRAGEQGFREHPTAVLPPVGPGDIVIPTFTASVPSRRPTLRGVWCGPAGLEVPNLADDSDAVFWSNGAIEQFLYPYYASKGGIRNGLQELVAMSYVWMGQVPPGMGPDRERTRNGGKSHGPQGVAGGGASAADVDLGAEVLDLHHLSTSEWVITRPAVMPDAPGADRFGAPGIVSGLSALQEMAVGYRRGGAAYAAPGSTFITEQWHRRP